MKKINTKRALLVAALSLSNTMMFIPTPAFAADATVHLAGQAAFEVPAAAGGYSAISRAEIMQKNLDNALIAAANQGPAAVNVAYQKGIPIIRVGGHYIGSVDAASAKAAGTTPALLAQRWASSLRNLMADSANTSAYVAQLTGGERTQFGSVSQTANVPQLPIQPTFAHIPAGMTMEVALTTSVSSETARPGDVVEARLDNPIALGEFTIPAGTVISGRVAESEPGKRLLARAGALELKFNSMRLPNGQTVPIYANVTSGMNVQQSVYGKVTRNPIGRTAVSGTVGAGLGAALGTAIGAIAGRSGKAVGTGAWSGAAIGGGVGAMHALFLAKGQHMVIPSGQRLTLQLQAPSQIALTPGVMTGAF